MHAGNPTLPSLRFSLVLLLFFSMGVAESLSAPQQQQQQQNPCWLVVDFDGTCTERDTTPLLPKLASILERNREDMEQRLSTFTELENEFFKLYGDAKEKMCHKTMSLDEALDTLDDASNHVTAKVSESRVLRGLFVPPERFLQVIKDDEEIRNHVSLRPECVEVITQATNTKQWKLGILSINWCPSLIDAALLRPLVRYGKDQGLPGEFLDAPIWSNSVDEEGNVSLQVPGALAKKNRITELKSSLGDQSTVIYVGDSSTDLAALVAADIGILIGQSKSTIAIAKQWGVQVVPLKDRPKMVDDGETMANIIWTVDAWSEIGIFLVG